MKNLGVSLQIFLFSSLVFARHTPPKPYVSEIPVSMEISIRCDGDTPNPADGFKLNYVTLDGKETKIESSDLIYFFVKEGHLTVISENAETTLLGYYDIDKLNPCKMKKINSWSQSNPLKFVDGVKLSLTVIQNIQDCTPFGAGTDGFIRRDEMGFNLSKDFVKMQLTSTQASTPFFLLKKDCETPTPLESADLEKDN